MKLVGQKIRNGTQSLVDGFSFGPSPELEKHETGS